ncbi:hypothetical protein Egran_00390 [Elaphomyces granulatus]|uniref:Uncharacterized protein n=1 Tax=Elaphomyces granulatus TaxID=519963 RepID=A0A232M630_9EURO|nr:hypothetical protein Egran_00390 [Elaphomyces granulatus]
MITLTRTAEESEAPQAKTP